MDWRGGRGKRKGGGRKGERNRGGEGGVYYGVGDGVCVGGIGGVFENDLFDFLFLFFDFSVEFVGEEVVS